MPPAVVAAPTLYSVRPCSSRPFCAMLMPPWAVRLLPDGPCTTPPSLLNRPLTVRLPAPASVALEERLNALLIVDALANDKVPLESESAAPQVRLLTASDTEEE